MLATLEVKDFAIIKDVKVDFTTGFSALIGETGAGKSILIDALSILLGARAASDLVRHGQDKSVITGLFILDQHSDLILQKLADFGLPMTDDQLVIKREISIKGRNVVRINGQITTNNVLLEIGQYLVDIHGQNDQQILMNEEQHINLLDQFAGPKITKQLGKYQEEFAQYQSLLRQEKTLRQDTQSIAQRQDILAFQVDEIENANLEDENEDQEIEDEYNKLLNFQKIQDGALNIQNTLENSETNIVDLTAGAMNQAQDLSKFSHDYDTLNQNLTDAYYALDEARTNVNDLLDNLDFDQERYQYLIDRIELLNNLKKKYGPSLKHVMEFFNKSQNELEMLNNQDFDMEHLQKEIVQKQEVLTDLAQDLTQKRRQVAQDLTAQIQAELKNLYMDKAKFQVKITAESDFNDHGQDQVVFYMLTNPGEDFKPLVKIASGGEQSRIILALKVIFANLTNVPTMIFDEIDTGVSGRVASAIGQKMLELSKDHQVLTITHSPQVAATADLRYLIEKKVVNDETFTQIKPLDLDESITAIAGMIAGENVTPAAIKNATELLDK